MPHPAPTTMTVAPNGGRRTKADHPGIPLTPAELARTAAACLEAGACMIHTHVRRPDGTHLLDADAYAEALAAIRAAVGQALVIQITSEALGLYKAEEQMAVVRRVRPEAVSLALRELVPDAAAERPFADFLAWMRAEAICPQIILYSPDEALRLADLQRRGVLPYAKPSVLYVLGRYTVGQVSDPSDLLPFLAPGLPVFDHWSVCAFGRHEIACVTAAALLGGHMRIGFENNLCLPDGSTAASNADLIAAAAMAAKACGLRIGTADDMRRSMARALDA